MRDVRISKTAIDQLNTLLEQGIDRFGPRVVGEKRDVVYDTIYGHLVRHPATKTPHRRLRLHVYPISNTPFVVLYDFDDSELRVHFLLHRRASLKQLDPKSAEW